MTEQKRIVLIVDDNPTNIHELSSMLIDDYDVICSTNGEKAIRLASEFLPDIILLDLMMPIMDGYEVCTRLKGMAKTRDIPIIFVTARDDPGSETRGLDIGAVDFVTKPMNPEIVRARVRNHLTRRMVEEALRSTARRLSEAEELAHVGAWEWNVADDRFYLSEEWLHIHGCADPSMAFGELMTLVHSDDRARVTEALAGAVAGSGKFDLNYRIKRRSDDAIRIVQVRGHSQLAHDGTPRRMFGATQDVTEQKLAELELARLKAAAEEANRAKSAFLATMSHELRTPLTSIIGFSEIIRDQSFGPVGTPAYAEYADDINASGLHLLDLINDILDIAKIESGKMVIVSTTVDVRTMLTSIHRLVGQWAIRQKLTLSLSVPTDIPVLWADERAIKQIVYNMLSNAIKFTPSLGQVMLAAEVGQCGGVDIRVTDTGIGIPAEEMARILRPFEQVENCYARSRGGSGLGLPLIKGLIELHNGTLAIESFFGKGTTVRVWFPPKQA